MPIVQSELTALKRGAAWSITAGDSLTVVDVEGGQTGGVFVVATDDLEDGLSNGRTFDHSGSIRLSVGAVLYSRRGRALLTIVEDEVGVHDFLHPPCGQNLFEPEYDYTDRQSNCLGDLTASLARFGVQAATVTTPFNVFRNVGVGPDGDLQARPPVSKPGEKITFVANRDILIAINACSAPCVNGDGARALRVEIGVPSQGLGIWSGAAPTSRE